MDKCLSGPEPEKPLNMALYIGANLSTGCICLLYLCLLLTSVPSKSPILVSVRHIHFPLIKKKEGK